MGPRSVEFSTGWEEMPTTMGTAPDQCGTYAQPRCASVPIKEVLLKNEL